MESKIEEQNNVISFEKIAESIRAVRDQTIVELLSESKLMPLLKEHFKTVAISKVKLEFLRRDLKELKNSSLDLGNYSSLIRKMKESSSIAPPNHPLFFVELKSVFEKHGVISGI